MGGRGKGISWGDRQVSGGVSATAVLTQTPGREGRPWSVQGWDEGGRSARWAVDARGRARTFATESAAREYVQRAAGVPVSVTVAGRAEVSGVSEAAVVAGMGGSGGAAVDRGRAAVVLVDGYAGRREFACRVVGETPARYRIEVDSATPLPSRSLAPGESMLVPREAVRFPVVVTVAGRQEVSGLSAVASGGSLGSTGEGGGTRVGVDSLERCREVGRSIPPIVRVSSIVSGDRRSSLPILSAMPIFLPV